MPVRKERAGLWNDNVWAAIDDDVKKTVGAIRVAQKVFPSIQLSDATSVPADDIDSSKMTISEGSTKPYVELSVKFLLTSGQVNADPTGTAVTILAKRAATYLANAEDMVILQGAGSTESGAVPLAPQVAIEAGAASIKKGGIVGIAMQTVPVNPPGSRPPKNSGEKILKAIEDGISRLTTALQAPPLALILHTNASAATFGSVINGVPTNEVLSPLLTGGIYASPAMSANTGLLIALGGDLTTIYLGSDPVTEMTQQESGGRYAFRIFERIQYVARDAAAFVVLDFS
jgi:uncharacterized linocin/CFP29 family protein